MITRFFFSLRTSSIEQVDHVLQEVGNEVELRITLHNYLNFGSACFKIFPHLGIKPNATAREIMLDFRLLDITQPVIDAIRQELQQVDYLTLLVMPSDAGLQMLQNSIEVMDRFAQNHGKRPKLIGIADGNSASDVTKVIQQQTNAAVQYKLDGLMCRGNFLPWVRAISRTMFVTAYGVRLYSPPDDYQRCTLREAEERGADAVLIGEEILRAERPHMLLTDMRNSLRSSMIATKPTEVNNK